jgi:hypothetical protein
MSFQFMDTENENFKTLEIAIFKEANIKHNPDSIEKFNLSKKHSQQRLKLCVDLIHEKDIDISFLFSHKDDAVFVAILDGLSVGSSPKLLGVLLLSYIIEKPLPWNVNERPCLSLIQNGGFLEYDKPLQTFQLRQSLYASCVFGNGSTYRGGWIAGRMSGFGLLENSNGKTIFKGNFKDNKPHGAGKLFDDKGKLVYDGAFENGKRNGFGTAYSAGLVCSGIWIQDELTCVNAHYEQKKNSKTRLITIFDGEFRNGKSHGYGVEKSIPESDKNAADDKKVISSYHGYFENGKKHGLGLFYEKHTVCFVGLWWHDDLKFVLRKATQDFSLHDFMSKSETLTPFFDSEIVQLLKAAPRSIGTQTVTDTACLPQPPARPTHANVFSTTTLTNLPRKEFIVDLQQPVHVLSAMSQHATVFFVAGNVFEVYPITTAKTSIAQMTSEILVGPTSTLCFQYVRCSVCMSAEHMYITTEPKNPDYETIACVHCAKKQNIVCIHCKICARVSNNMNLFSSDAGQRLFMAMFSGSKN